MRKLLDIINVNEEQIIVLSAVSGTTNALLAIAGYCLDGVLEKAFEHIEKLYQDYRAFAASLVSEQRYRAECNESIDASFSCLKRVAGEDFSKREEKIVLSFGEVLSTGLFHVYLKSIGVVSVLLPALDFMRTDEDGEPDISFASEHLTRLVAQYPTARLFITQGYICRNSAGEIDNLRRGGSDYTASLIGAAIRASEVQIWTDIDGMHNNDPRIVSGTLPIRQLSFNEAAELAYFGAKILHPQSVFPVQKYKIPLRLLNTMQPDAHGTLISDFSERGKIKSIAAKDGITAIKIQSSRMLLAFGFLRRIFEIFERYRTPVDMITTSEVAVSLTIDDSTYLPEITEALQELGNVEVDSRQAIICVVGDFGPDKSGYASKVFEPLKHIPIRMISYGGSNYNVSIVVHEEHKADALQSLHQFLFIESTATTEHSTQPA
jgi:aspartate kinase